VRAFVCLRLHNAKREAAAVISLAVEVEGTVSAILLLLDPLGVMILPTVVASIADRTRTARLIQAAFVRKTRAVLVGHVCIRQLHVEVL